MAVKTRFYTESVIARIKDATAEELAAFAFQIEAQAKVNIQENRQIDTGFMLNSVYTVSQAGSSYGSANKTGAYNNRAGSKVKRKIAPERSLPKKAAAIVAVGADYAIYQEEKKSFLYRAAQTASSEMAKDVKLNIKKRLKDG